MGLLSDDAEESWAGSDSLRDDTANGSGVLAIDGDCYGPIVETKIELLVLIPGNEQVLVVSVVIVVETNEDLTLSHSCFPYLILVSAAARTEPNCCSPWK